MSRPFFSIAIPCKNRPDRMRNAIRSVLEQTFGDLEVIVCDNSDEAAVAETAAAAAAFDDPRVRYVRTNGRLSMPDNWEHAVRDTRGEFVGILTDRSVLRRDALQTAHDVAARTGSHLVCWFPDRFGGDAAGREFRRRKSTLREYTLDTAEVLHYFLSGHPKSATKMVPKLMSAVCHHSVLDAIRASALGRVCLPVAPDFTSGFLMLAHTPRMVLLDDGLFVSCGRGNGSAFRHRGELAQRFLADLGMTWRDVVGLAPTEACFTHALTLNDFLRLKQALPEVFAPYEPDRRQYYAGCLTDYVRAARGGAELSDDYDLLLAGLALEDDDVQAFVRTRQVYLDATTVLPGGAGDPEPGPDGAAEPGALAAAGSGFDSVFDALAWAESHPRVPSGGSPVEMPSLESLKPWNARRLGAAVTESLS
ncbi:MAG: glycosyltransferase family 2 protein [Vicinamibacterales bacterium]